MDKEITEMEDEDDEEEDTGEEEEDGEEEEEEEEEGEEGREKDVMICSHVDAIKNSWHLYEPEDPLHSLIKRAIDNTPVS